MTDPRAVPARAPALCVGLRSPRSRRSRVPHVCPMFVCRVLIAREHTMLRSDHHAASQSRASHL
eukprot:220010-Prymnesium_polylepis.3